MDKAALDAVLAGPDDKKLDMAVTCAWEAKKALEDMPDQIAAAISMQRGRDKKFMAGLAGGIALTVSLITPIVLHFV